MPRETGLVKLHAGHFRRNHHESVEQQTHDILGTVAVFVGTVMAAYGHHRARFAKRLKLPPDIGARLESVETRLSAVETRQEDDHREAKRLLNRIVEDISEVKRRLA